MSYPDELYRQYSSSCFDRMSAASQSSSDRHSRTEVQDRLPVALRTYKDVTRDFFDFKKPERLNENLVIPYSLRFGIQNYSAPNEFNSQASIAKKCCDSCWSLNKCRPIGAQEIICVVSPGYARCSLCICLNLPFYKCNAYTVKSRQGYAGKNVNKTVEEKDQQSMSSSLRKRGSSKQGVDMLDDDRSSDNYVCTDKSPSESSRCENNSIKRSSTTSIASEMYQSSLSSAESESIKSTKKEGEEIKSSDEKRKDEPKVIESDNNDQKVLITDLCQTNFQQKQKILDLEKQLANFNTNQNEIEYGAGSSKLNLQARINQYVKDIGLLRSEFCRLKQQYEEVKKQKDILQDINQEYEQINAVLYAELEERDGLIQEHVEQYEEGKGKKRKKSDL